MANPEFELRYGGRPHVGTTVDRHRGPPISAMRWLSSFSDVLEALRSPHFEQGGGGRRDSAVVVGDSMLALSGTDHFDRRRIEGALFTRQNLMRMERDVFLPRFMRELEVSPRGHDGRFAADLLVLVRCPLLEVSTRLAGLDLDGSAESEQRLLALMASLAVGVNLEWIDRDHQAAIEVVRADLERFRAEYFRPAWDRRAALVEAVQCGRASEADLPLDLITLILRNPQHFGRWDADLPIREVILVNGAPSTIPQTISHAFRHLLAWAGEEPALRALLTDRNFLRAACFESLRVNPATPFLIRRAVTDVVMRSGTHVPAGQYVVVDLLATNRDPAAYPDPERFDPTRKPIGDVRPGALAFGSGPHTCIGVALTMGDALWSDNGICGLVVLVLRELFLRGVTSDPDLPPVMHLDNVRNEYRSFPIRFAARGGGPEL